MATTLLVSGASEPIGEALLARLIAEGRSVRALARRPHRLWPLAAAGRLDCREWHPATEPLPPAALEGIGTLVALDGDPLTGRPVDACAARRVDVACRAMEKLAAAAAEAGTRRLIALSSVAIYADVAGEVYTETSELGTGTSLLMRAARDLEAAAALARAAGARTAIVRVGLVVGVDPAVERVLADLASGRAERLLPRLPPLIHLTDLVALLVGLIDNPDVAGPINAVTPAAVSGADMREAGKARRKRLALPDWVLRHRYGAAAELVLRNSRVVPRRLNEEGCTFAHPDARSGLLASVATPARTTREQIRHGVGRLLGAGTSMLRRTS